MCESFFHPEMMLLLTDIFSTDYQFLSYLALTSNANMKYIFNKCQYVTIDDNVSCVTVSCENFYPHYQIEQKMSTIANHLKLVCHSGNDDNKKYLVTDYIMERLEFDIFNVSSFTKCKYILIVYNLLKHKNIFYKNNFSKCLVHRLDCLNKVKYDTIQINLKTDINAKYLLTNCNLLILSANFPGVRIICNTGSFKSPHITKFSADNCRFYNPDLISNNKISMFDDKITSFTCYIDNIDISNMCNLEFLRIKQSIPFQKTLIDFSKFAKLAYLSINSYWIIPTNMPQSIKTLYITVDSDCNYDFSKLVNLESIVIKTTGNFFPRFKIPDDHKVWKSSKYISLN